MKALALALLLAGCVSSPGPRDLLPLSLHTQHERGSCSGTPVGRSTIRTAMHCFVGGSLVRVNGVPVQVRAVVDKGADRAVVVLSGIVFDRWATEGPTPQAGDRVRWWGAPLGHPNVYREGVVTWAGDGLLLVDAMVCVGDSGAGVFNARGELVGMVRAIGPQVMACSFMQARPL